MAKLKLWFATSILVAFLAGSCSHQANALNLGAISQLRTGEATPDAAAKSTKAAEKPKKEEPKKAAETPKKEEPKKATETPKKEEDKKATEKPKKEEEAKKPEAPGGDVSASKSEMGNLEKNVEVMLGYMMGTSEVTVPKLTQWCKQFGENIGKAKGLSQLTDNR